MKPPKNIIVGKTLKPNWKPNPGHVPLFGNPSFQDPKKLSSAKFAKRNFAPQSDNSKNDFTLALNNSTITFPCKSLRTKSEIPLSNIREIKYFCNEGLIFKNEFSKDKLTNVKNKYLGNPGIQTIRLFIQKEKFNANEHTDCSEDI